MKKSSVWICVLSLMATLALRAERDAPSESDSSAVERALADTAAAHLAKPTPGQIEWADMELQMFVHFGVATWEGREYDADGKMDLSKMNPEGFDPEQICLAAKSWGAKQVMLVCKHVGGFCWWPTETTDYSVRNIPWKDGKGNLVKEVADACRKHGLKLGIYIYSDDVRYTRAIGRGGRTDDPARQEEWNVLLRQQWTEVLTLCGSDLVREIWFDGGCIVPLLDIIKKLAPEAQIFGGPHATVRWPGSESGKLPYPCWSSMAANSDAAIGDPDGSKWLPPEADTVLYGRGGHNWFWSPENERRRHTLPELMEIYLKSVGRGGVLLLNSSPNTDGRIPEGDMGIYAAFGAEIQRRFGNPLERTNGVGETLELDLLGARKVNQVWIMEDTRGGHRIRGYAIEGRNASGQWETLAEGISVGHKRIEVFADATVDKLRLRVTKSVGTPIVRDFAAFHADGIESVKPLSEGKPTTASSTHSAPYVAGMSTDGSSETRWGAEDSDTDAWLEVDLGKPQSFGKVVLSELGDRIREFVIEYRNDTTATWQVAFTGGAVGPHYSQEFPTVTGRYARVRVVRGGNLGPTLWEFELWPGRDASSPCGAWAEGAASAKLDLTPHIKLPATYEVTVGPAKVISARLLFNGVEMPPEDAVIRGDKVMVRQTQQVTANTNTELELQFASGNPGGNASIRMMTGE